MSKKSKIILQVHDELVFDAHVSEIDFLKENVIKLMENALLLHVRIGVEAGIGKIGWKLINTVLHKKT